MEPERMQLRGCREGRVLYTLAGGSVPGQLASHASAYGGDTEPPVGMYARVDLLGPGRRGLAIAASYAARSGAATTHEGG